MAKKSDETPPSAVAKMEELLAYRLPQSGKPLGSIVLSRAHAEEILKEIYDLREKSAQAESQILKWSQARSESPSLE